MAGPLAPGAKPLQLNVLQLVVPAIPFSLPTQRQPGPTITEDDRIGWILYYHAVEQVPVVRLFDIPLRWRHRTTVQIQGRSWKALH